jgi:hypothetical protein
MPELIADLERSLVKKQMVKGFWAYSQWLKNWIGSIPLAWQPSHNNQLILLGNPIKNTMNILGVTFDSKLQRSTQVSNVILKANCSLCTIKLLKKFYLQNMSFVICWLQNFTQTCFIIPRYGISKT